MKIINDFVKRLFWKFLAQRSHLRSQSRNKWRQSEDFMNQTITLFNSWGYQRNDFSGKYVIDVGAGSKLRSKFFHHAYIIVIEPLARKFLQSIPWNNLKDACRIYSCECEEKIPELVEKADFIMCINVLDHTYNPEAILRNCYHYLKSTGEFLLSVDLHKESNRMHPVCLNKSELLKNLAQISFQICREYDGLQSIDSDHYGYGRAFTVILRKAVPDRNI